MWKLLFLIGVAAVLMVILKGTASADEPTPSRVIQVRLGNLEAAADVAGTVTFELTDESGVTQTATSEFRADAGEPLEDLTASFTYQGPFRWRIHIADDGRRQLSLLEGKYPGYPYATTAPLSSRLRVTDPAASVVFLDFLAFMLEFEAIAVLRDQEGLDRVHATAGLDSDGSGVFDPDEVVNTSTRPEDRLVRVTVPRLSSNVSTASFFIKLESPGGEQLANLEGTWTFDGGESLAFDLDAPQIRDITGFYGRPKPSQTVSSVALPNPWDLTPVSLTSASDGADFSFLLGRDLDLIWAEIAEPSPALEAQALVTVTTEDGTVVEGATVTVAGEEFITDEFGRVTLFAPPGFHEAVITAEGFDSGSADLDLMGGETQTVQVILYRPGPGPLESANGFLAEHWLTIVIAAGTALALAMLVLALLTPSRTPQAAR